MGAAIGLRVENESFLGQTLTAVMDCNAQTDEHLEETAGHQLTQPLTECHYVRPQVTDIFNILLE